MPYHQYSQQMRIGLANSSRSLFRLAAHSLLLIWCVGMFGRNYWTPDEPREAATLRGA